MNTFLQFLLLSITLLLFSYLLPKIIKTKSRLIIPPGPPKLPFIGNLHQLDFSSFHTYLWQLSKIYGPIVSLRFGSIEAIVISSPNLAKEVMRSQDLNFCSRPPLFAQQKVSYNGLDVAFSPYNDYCREMKKIFTLHLLSPKKVKSFHYIREDEVSRAMKKIHALALTSKPVNLSEIVMDLASTIIMRVGFGKRYEDEGRERKKVIQLLHELQAMMANLFVEDFWPNFPFIGLIDNLMGRTNRLEKCFQDFDKFYQELIEEHLKSQNPKTREQEDIIDILLRLKKDKLIDPIELTYDHIKALLMDVLAAGTDTSASVVIWAMNLLMKNPKVMKKAQEEVRKMVINKGEVDEDDLPKLTFLKAVVKETMRLYPPTPLLLPRETMKKTILNGYDIKPKTIVYVNALAVGRDPESWEWPEKFSPERFLGTNVSGEIDFKGNNFELIPFGGGRRLCPGISMGVITVELLLSNLIYLFDWQLPQGMTEEDIDFEFNPGLTIHKKNDLCLQAQV